MRYISGYRKYFVLLIKNFEKMHTPIKSKSLPRRDTLSKFFITILGKSHWNVKAKSRFIKIELKFCIQTIEVDSGRHFSKFLRGRH